MIFEKKILVFVTRGEITIDSDNTLAIHLRPSDRRLKKVARGIRESNLQLVIVNASIVNINTTFYRNNWYLVQHLKYTASWDHDRFTHFSFEYKLNNKSYDWQKEGVRMLNSDEVSKFKKTLSI